MSERTTLDRQISAVNMSYERTGLAALKDAKETLCRLKNLDNLIHDEPPDLERISQLLEELLLGS